MKKNRTIIVAVLAIVLTLAVGYALFSQTINITGTATAQGSFEIKTMCIEGISSDISSKITGTTEAGYSNVTCTPSTLSVSDAAFSATLAYPGAKRYFTIKMENTGSIDATLKMSTDITQTFEFCNDEDKNGTFESSECATSGQYIDAFVGAFVNIDGFVFSDGTSYYGGNDAGIANFTPDGDEVTIKHGDSIYIVYHLEFPSDYDNNYIYTKAMLSQSFDWKQAN